LREDEGDELIAVRDSNSTAPITMIRKKNFDPGLHFRLSSEEVAQIGQPKSAGGGSVSRPHGTPR
jgi:hypothetical protein